MDRIYRLAYRMAGEEDPAKDFAQEAFLRAYQRLDQSRGDAAFSTWPATSRLDQRCRPRPCRNSRKIPPVKRIGRPERHSAAGAILTRPSALSE
ncbi:MAG: hypothetical protein IIB36_16945 [Gemmatimonadetes bacterium]|nr:hypothetical protein [Gemmatimonadota bacterium]